MANRSERPMDADEFLLWCLDQEDRYELVNGFPVKMGDGPQMMTGASSRHDRFVTNLIFLFVGQLRGSRCFPTTADIAVRTKIKMVRRPDVTVTCGEPRDDVYEAEDPKMVVEVLSPSNKGVGWQRKLEEYRHLIGLHYILLVETGAIGASLLSRGVTGAWVPSDYDTLAGVPPSGFGRQPNRMSTRRVKMRIAGAIAVEKRRTWHSQSTLCSAVWAAYSLASVAGHPGT